MTLLAIDAGNTRVKWALHDGAQWTGHGATPTAHARTHGVEFGAHAAHRLIASNVAGADAGKALERAAAVLGKPLAIIAAQATQCGVTNGYRHPAQLGTDRWAALVGARAVHAHTHPTMILLAGTALTVDALDGNGHHLGGIIVPGASLMRSALASGTAQLPDEAGEAPRFPASTVEAIATGAFDALAGAVERFHRRVSERCGVAPLVIGTGGALAAIAPNLPFPVAIHDNLIFEGLRAIAEDTPTHP